MPEDVTLIVTVVKTPKIADTFSSNINFIYQHLEISLTCLRERCRINTYKKSEQEGNENCLILLLCQQLGCVVTVVEEINGSMEHWWNDTDIASPKYSERNLF